MIYFVLAIALFAAACSVHTMLYYASSAELDWQRSLTLTEIHILRGKLADLESRLSTRLTELDEREDNLNQHTLRRVSALESKVFGRLTD